MNASSMSDVLRLVADHLPAQDPADFVAAVAWRLDQRAAATEAVVARLVNELAQVCARPVNVIRLEHGLPLLPNEPAPEVVKP